MQNNLNEKYNAPSIETKWQNIWKQANDGKGLYYFDKKLPGSKLYVLDMFPYPSGAGLHVGHPKGYTATDVFARFKRLNGYNVLHPIGWDAFGLPAEQYAIDTKNSPKDFTNKNINHFKKQLDNLGFCFPNNKIINTTDPNYYKWTQWIFLQMYKKGLAEIKNIEVNWCPNLGTVLSNEEILLDKNNIMVSERGNHPVIKKPMKQWVLKITKYAEKLLDGLDTLDWPSSVKEAQKKWIGKINGAIINCQIFNKNTKLSCFIVEPSILEYASYVVLPYNFPDIKNLIDSKNLDIKNYISKCYTQDNSKLSNISNQISGIFTNLYLINPINSKKIPIWISKDFKFYNYLPRICTTTELVKEEKIFANFFKIPFNPIPNHFDIKNNYTKVIKFLKDKNLGHAKVEYNLHDWIFSRQRYWGEPFPIYFDKNYNIYPIDEKELPLLLPELKSYTLSNDIKGPLSKIKSWIEFSKNNEIYYHDSNTMPQWAGSSWYYIAYILKQDNDTYLDLNSPDAKKLLKKWLPVDLYIGGQEHAVLHLLYARFWHLFLYDLGIVSHKEPFQKLFNQGMILGENGEKMSKSKGNVINPDLIIQNLGADTLRLYEMFMGPLNSTLKWSNDSLLSMNKWLERVYNLFIKENYIIQTNNSNLELAINFLLKNTVDNINSLKYNICISDMMIYINKCYQEPNMGIEQANKFLIILSCFCPHIADEIFNWINKFKSFEFLYNQKWPTINYKILEKTTCNIICQVNGKLRATILTDLNLLENEVIELAKKEPNIAKYLNNSMIMKIIYVPNKLINFVIK